jgi:hypothetical protein
MSDKAPMSLEQIRDSNDVAAGRFADAMVELLSAYIPEQSRRDAWETLQRAAVEHGFQLTSVQPREPFEGWKQGTEDIPLAIIHGQ